MGYISEQLKYKGGYADSVMMSESISDMLGIGMSLRFVGLTVTVKNVVSSLSADFWLVGGISKTNWKLKNAPVFTSTEQRDDFTTALTTASGNIIPKGFIVTVSTNESTDKYYYDGSEWQPYESGGVPIYGEDSGSTI